MQGKIAFIYPGQGAQSLGMGKDFYERCGVAKESFLVSNKVLDFDLEEICFKKNDLLNETAYVQPAIVAFSLAVTKELKHFGIQPDVTAGLSLGEYSAIAAAGGLSDEEVIKLVRARGIYMQEATKEQPGTMAAVLGMEKEQLQKEIEGREGVWIANYNCPGQIVITGKKEAIATAREDLKKAGAKRIIPLKVSGAFHSPMMENAARRLEQVLVDSKTSPLVIPYVTNVTASLVNTVSSIKPILVKQMTHPVLWEQSVHTMIDMGVRTFLEVGPGRTLTNFIKKIDSTVTTFSVGTVEEFNKILGEM